MDTAQAEEKILTAKTEDMFSLCGKYAAPRFSAFLDGAMQKIIEERFMGRYGYHTLLFGGYAESERRIFGVFPEWQAPEQTAFPIRVLKITHTFGDKLSHRDYLGSILSLGIDRGKTGDILIDEHTAYAFVTEDIAAYVQQELKKIGSRGVCVAICAIDEIIVPQKEFERIEAVAASLRLDAVIAAAVNLSRGAAAEAVKSGKISVNHRIAGDGSAVLACGDLISIRGSGRFLLESTEGMTRKGRRHIVLKKYI